MQLRYFLYFFQNNSIRKCFFLIFITTISIVLIDAISRGLYQKTIDYGSQDGDIIIKLYEKNIKIDKKTIDILFQDLKKKYCIQYFLCGVHHGLMVQDTSLVPVVFIVDENKMNSGNGLFITQQISSLYNLYLNDKVTLIIDAAFNYSKKCINNITYAKCYIKEIVNNNTKDSSLVFTFSPHDFYCLFEKEGINYIKIFLSHNKKSETAAISQIIKQYNLGSVHVWFDMAQEFYSITLIERYSFIAILFLLLIVASVSCLSFIYIFYQERKEDIISYFLLGFSKNIIIRYHFLIIFFYTGIATLLGGCFGYYASLFFNFFQLNIDGNIVILIPSYYSIYFFIIWYMIIVFYYSYKNINLIFKTKFI